MRSIASLPKSFWRITSDSFLKKKIKLFWKFPKWLTTAGLFALFLPKYPCINKCGFGTLCKHTRKTIFSLVIAVFRVSCLLSLDIWKHSSELMIFLQKIARNCYFATCFLGGIPENKTPSHIAVFKIRPTAHGAWWMQFSCIFILMDKEATLKGHQQLSRWAG